MKGEVISINKLIKVFVHEYDLEKIENSLTNIKQINSISHGDKLCLGDVELFIHHTPGHTKGSISVVSDKGHLFTGDAFLAGDDVMFISDANDFMR